MTAAPVFALFAVGLAIVIAVGVLAARQAKKRRDQFATYAAAKGWSHVPRDDSWTSRFPGPPFDTGHNKQARNVLQGAYDGRPFVAMDYVFHTTETSTDSNGRTTSSEQSHNFSVSAIDTGTPFPALSVAPEGFFGRLVGRVTGQDIDLESEDFNRAFTVHADDRKFASDVLHPRMMEALLRSPDASFRFVGTWVLSAYAGSHKLDQLEHRLALIDTVIDQVPEFVWQDRKALG